MTALERINACEVASHKVASGEHEGFGPLHALSTGLRTPWDTAWHDGTRPMTLEELRKLEEFYAAHGQDVVIYALSHAAPSLLSLMRQSGYGLEQVLHVYAHDLERLPESFSLPVQAEADAGAWAQISALGFGEGSQAITNLVARNPEIQRFTAYLDGERAGTAAMQFREGVAALHGASTRPEFRCRGVQAALLAHRLHAAKAQRAQLASVFVTPAAPSERNIRRAGFELAGMRLTFRKELQRT